MTGHIDRRGFVWSGAMLAMSFLLPVRLRAALADIPRSAFGAETTADEALAGIDLSGKTALITGVNSGIGYESMRSLAGHGAHVIGTARTIEKAKQACDSVKGRTTPVVCELSEFDSIVACTHTVRALKTPVDILICNAGIMALPKLEQVNGIERQFAVNHLGHYLLTRRLADQVEAAKQGRIVMVSSVGYKNAPPAGIEFDNLSGEKGYKPFVAYGQSKLANALFSMELARRYQGTTVTSNVIHPGLVATNLGRHIMRTPRDPNAPLRPGFKTPAQGAATQVYVASHPNMAGVSGHYFEDCNPVEPDGPHMQNLELAARLWEVSAQLTKNYLS